jgi:hypothetical protein
VRRRGAVLVRWRKEREKKETEKEEENLSLHGTKLVRRRSAQRFPTSDVWKSA